MFSVVAVMVASKAVMVGENDTSAPMVAEKALMVAENKASAPKGWAHYQPQHYQLSSFDALERVCRLASNAAKALVSTTNTRNTPTPH
mmetsp:Transcript_18647/g.33385  ORF Transcript_18647/g.33385 Transcript_18647/m.33385 type:complete len:88 (+) Transcript_18647:523-786(+)